MSVEKGRQGASRGAIGPAAQAKPSHKQVLTQPEKRSNTEMDNSSFWDEITMINKQLEQLSDDTKKTAEKVKDMLTKDEMKDFITTTINALVKELVVRLEKDIDSKIEKSQRKDN